MNDNENTTCDFRLKPKPSFYKVHLDLSNVSEEKFVYNLIPIMRDELHDVKSDEIIDKDNVHEYVKLDCEDYYMMDFGTIIAKFHICDIEIKVTSENEIAVEAGIISLVVDEVLVKNINGGDDA